GTSTVGVDFPELAWSGGSLIINAGSIRLRNTVGDAASGSLKGDPTGDGTPYGGIINVQVNPTGALIIDNSNGIYDNPTAPDGAEFNRLGPSATVFLTGGELRVIGNATQTLNQQVGGSIALGGYSTVTVVSQGQATSVDGGTLSRAPSFPYDKGTGLVRGVDGVNTK